MPGTHCTPHEVGESRVLKGTFFPIGAISIQMINLFLSDKSKGRGVSSLLVPYTLALHIFDSQYHLGKTHILRTECLQANYPILWTQVFMLHANGPSQKVVSCFLVPSQIIRHWKSTP